MMLALVVMASATGARSSVRFLSGSDGGSTGGFIRPINRDAGQNAVPVVVNWTRMLEK